MEGGRRKKERKQIYAVLTAVSSYISRMHVRTQFYYGTNNET
jgi:hypothetical protein